MKDISRAQEYASTINALTQGNFDEILSSVRSVVDSLEKTPALTRFFDHPGIPAEEKLTVMDRISGVGEGLLSHVLRKLVARYDIKLLPLILTELERIQKRNAKTLDVVIQSAVALTGAQKLSVDKRLAELTGMTILARHEVDATLIGGLRMRIGDRVVDTSLRTRMESLANQLSVASLQ